MKSLHNDFATRVRLTEYRYTRARRRRRVVKSAGDFIVLGATLTAVAMLAAFITGA